MSIMALNDVHYSLAHLEHSLCVELIREWWAIAQDIVHYSKVLDILESTLNIDSDD